MRALGQSLVQLWACLVLASGAWAQTGEVERALADAAQLEKTGDATAA